VELGYKAMKSVNEGLAACTAFGVSGAWSPEWLDPSEGI
jgi:hypothetical protein